MKRYPFVKQVGFKDCGSACTLMILKYYGGYVSLNKLDTILKVDNTGISAYNIIEALKSFGFDSFGYKYDSLSSIKCPSILHIKINSYTHYVVIWEINYKKKTVLIGDPSRGNIVCSFDEIMSMWTGYTVESIPIRKVLNEKHVNTFDFLYKLIISNLFDIICLIILSFVIVVCSLLISFFLQFVISYKDDDVLLFVFLFFTFIFILRSVLSFVRNRLLIKLDMSIDARLSNDTFNNIVSLPSKIRLEKTTGQILSYFGDLSLIKSFITKISITLFLDVPLVFISSLCLLFINSHLFFINLFISVLYFILFMFYRHKNYYLSSEVLRHRAMINSYIAENISGSDTIKNMCLEDTVKSRFKKKYSRYIDVSKHYNMTITKQRLYKDLIGNISIILIILYGVYYLRHGLSVSFFITLYFLSTLMCDSFENILDNDFDFEEVKASICHITDMKCRYDLKDKINVCGDIELSNLSYCFNKDEYVLKNICLNIKKGSKVFVSGASGSGKSTLFKIVKGYYDDYDGLVTIGGYDLKKYVFESVVYVSLKEVLFTGRLSDNLSIKGYDSFNSQICEIGEFTDEDIIIEENGFNLSDGQRQRIVLARALYSFEVLIIDEGLNDVDVNMERRILKRILKVYDSKTIIFISHRLVNKDLFDRFIEMKSGQIVFDETIMKGMV